MGSLDELCTQYYGAQLLDAVEFMHSRGVIHRDLKPENILLDDKMRIKVTDFGTAKLLANEVDQNGNKLMTFPKDCRASSFVGTAEYVSPELLADKVQGKGCDIWAFGCIIYQLIAGRPPFKASNEYQTFQKIVKLQYSFPPGFPMSVRDLVKHILVLDPSQRYSINRIKAHPFFEGVNWNRHSIWKQKHPRILPFRPSPRAASNPIAKITAGFPRHHNVQPDYVTSSQTNLPRATASSAINPRSASTSNILATNLPPYNPNASNAGYSSRVSPGEATAAPPPSSISAYNSQIQQTQNIPAPRPIQSQTREQQAYSASRQPQQHQQNLAQQNLAQPRLQQPVSVRSPISLTGAAVPPAPANPNETNTDANGGFGSAATVVPMELPPVSSFDEDFASLLQGGKERVLRVGHVHMTLSNEPIDSEKEPSRISRMFSGRKKKRTLVITTSGRMLIISDNKLQLELPIVNSAVKIKEFPFNKKLNVGTFSVETKTKVYTFEDPSGSADWMAAVARAKEYVANAEAVAAGKSHKTASAAALAAANNATQSKPLPTHRQIAPSSRRSTDIENINRGNYKNDDYKMRRGQSVSYK